MKLCLVCLFLMRVFLEVCVPIIISLKYRDKFSYCVLVIMLLYQIASPIIAKKYKLLNKA